MQIKIAYINAFNSMADQLQQISMSYFRNLWDQRLELEKLDATTFMWASFGAKRMVERKRELPGIKSSRARLKEKMQQQLFAVPKEAIAT
jgi:phage regulator Rha-like protein